MTTAIYNTHVGATYDSTRKADPKIVANLKALLAPFPSGQYLDVGCGTGNYTAALAEQENINITGLDLSSQMLESARKKSSKATWIEGSALELPFDDNTFNGAVCTLALHLIGDYRKALTEIFRVISSGKFVTFTFTPKMVRSYWLYHYFPKCMEKSASTMISENDLIDGFTQAGFKNIQRTSFYVDENPTDFFLYAGKLKPEIYLYPETMRNMSAFSLSKEEIEIDAGVKKLTEDITTGTWAKIAKEYPTPDGDCVFISGEKP